MSIKTGMMVVAGALALCGVLGMTQLGAFQGAGGSPEDDSLPIVDAIDAADGPSESSEAVLVDVVPSVAGIVFSNPASADSVGENNTASATPSASTSNRKRNAPASEFSRASARAVEQQIYQTFGTEKIPALEFPGDNSLADVLKFLSQHLSETTGLQLLVMLDPLDPDIGSDPEFLNSTIVSKVSLPEGSMTIASALELILARVTDQEPKLTWVIRNEVLLITTTASAESEENLILRSYDISRLSSVFPPSEQSWGVPTSRDSGGGGKGGGGGFFMLQENAIGHSPGDTSSSSLKNGTQNVTGNPVAPNPGTNETRVYLVPYVGLMDAMQQMTTPPCRWINNGDEIGTMTIAGNRLLVHQSRKGHEMVVKMLEELELAADEIQPADKRQPAEVSQPGSGRSAAKP